MLNIIAQFNKETAQQFSNGSSNMHINDNMDNNLENISQSIDALPNVDNTNREISQNTNVNNDSTNIITENAPAKVHNVQSNSSVSTLNTISSQNIMSIDTNKEMQPSNICTKEIPNDLDEMIEAPSDLSPNSISVDRKSDHMHSIKTIAIRKTRTEEVPFEFKATLNFDVIENPAWESLANQLKCKNKKAKTTGKSTSPTDSGSLENSLMMELLFWNIRGMNSLSKQLDILRILNTYRYSFIGIIENKLSLYNVDRFMSKISSN